MHVGRTGDLQRRRQEQTGLNNDRHAATFAFRRAVEEAVAAHPELAVLPRAQIEQHPTFGPYFKAWKERASAASPDIEPVEAPHLRNDGEHGPRSPGASLGRALT